ncbi:MAG: hypothetical protein JW958_03465 [Candidatus Eisenbacteria bacterium]|nr:hypothetical protein [Candidatus Eisenbacteria bacterium]
MKTTRKNPWALFAAPVAVLLSVVIVGPVIAQAVETPPIPITVTPLNRKTVIQWNQPSEEIISSLAQADSSWGGTAEFIHRGEYSGHCDMDITFRVLNPVASFRDPFVETVLFQGTDPSRPNYWTGTAVPYAGGEPDICENHNILVTALGSDVLLADGTASGEPILFDWLDPPDMGTFTLPADFRPGVDSIPVTIDVWISFGEGTIDSGGEFTVRAKSNDIQLSWSYVPEGGGETERVSSSDDGNDPLTICRPDDWVDFLFGLEVTITTDTTYKDSLVLEITARDSVVAPGDTITVYDTTETFVTVIDEILDDVPAGGDSLGVVHLNYRKIDGYRVYRNDITNPDRFVLLKDLNFCRADSIPRENATLSELDSLLADPFLYEDTVGVHNGFPYVYYVTAYDTLTHSESADSLKSNRIFPRSLATEDLDKILVVPNPYKRNAAWEEGVEQLQFTHLPARASIRIYTIGGDLIREWEHYDPSGGGNSSWDMRNDNGDLVVSGVYLYHVKSAAGGERVGKFIIVR